MRVEKENLLRAAAERKAAEEATKKANLQRAKAEATEKALNKVAADFVVAILNSIEDESQRRRVLNKVMNIIYG